MIVIDSCGWLSYFLGDSNASFFAPAIENTSQLIVPSLVVYEVCKRMRHVYGIEGETRAFAYLKLGQLANPDWDTLRLAAQSAKQYQLHMADAIIWQTAQHRNAMLYTQDATFIGVPGVVYQAK